MGVVVTGMGVISALGPDTAAFRRGLSDAVNACALHEFTRIDGTVAQAPAYIAVPTEPGDLIEPRKLRRMFRLARMAAVCARQALVQAGLDPSSVGPERLGVCFGTGFGALEVTQKFVDSWIDNGQASASPLQFMNSLHGVLASQIALDVNARGVNLTNSQRDICFETALDQAVHLLESGRADVLLFGGGDELTDLLLNFGVQTHQFTLDTTRPGLDPWALDTAVVPGDGAAVFVLEREDSPRRALAKIVATATGRHDVPGVDVLADVRQFEPELVTNTLDGSARAAPFNPHGISHRGNFGTFAAAGALQFAANVLMLAHAEYYEPLAAGVRSGRSGDAPASILHNAASISGNHAAYLLARA